MPIYEYACPKCGEFEVTQRITEDPLKKCPTCRSKVRKLISSTSFQLKGSGWYATDYAKKGAAAKSESKSESSASDTDGGTKSDGESKAKDTPSEKKSSPESSKSKAKDAASKAA
jgi:putative FmdB family regulatory protein